ncbi:hypothetical protein D3C72_2577950 [compost metagenome]
MIQLAVNDAIWSQRLTFVFRVGTAFDRLGNGADRLAAVKNLLVSKTSSIEDLINNFLQATAISRI